MHMRIGSQKQIIAVVAFVLDSLTCVMPILHGYLDYSPPSDKDIFLPGIQEALKIAQTRSVGEKSAGGYADGICSV